MSVNKRKCYKKHCAPIDDAIQSEIIPELNIVLLQFLHGKSLRNQDIEATSNKREKRLFLTHFFTPASQNNMRMLIFVGKDVRSVEWPIIIIDII